MWAGRSRLIVGLVVVVLAVGMAASSALGATIYVKEGGTGGGMSWADAYGGLQDALDAAGGEANQIWVAAGTYKPTYDYGLAIGDRGKHFRMINGVGIYGGFAGTETSLDERDVGNNETILSGDIGILGNNSDNCYHVFYHPEGTNLNATAILDGFTITAGNANESGSDRWTGGGMYNEDCDSTLTNCTFIGNSAEYGGGMRNRNSEPTLTNCTFIGNSATDSGGGITNDSFQTIGYIRSILTNCVFSGNTAEDRGGGMWNGSLTKPVLTNCTFSYNSSEVGGGIYNSSTTMILTNCIFWNSRLYDTDTTTSIVKYSCIPGWTGDGNIDANPLFIDADGADNVIGTKDDNVRLSFDSPCINMGDNSAVMVTSDADGNPRIIEVAVDMGAYETHPKDFSLSMWSIVVPEGGSATFTVALVADPQGEIEVTVARVSGDPDITVQSGGLLNFNSSNYSDPQVVTLAAAEDSDGLNGVAQIQVSGLGLLSVVVIANEADSVEVPSVLYVDGDSSGANNGTSWEDAFTDLQDALSFASTFFGVEEIHVAQGTYKPDRDAGNPTGSGLREATFGLISGVAIYGGYGGLGEPEPNERDIEAYETILSGDLNGDDGPDFVNNGENSYHVVCGNDTDGTAVLDGLTITAGNADDDSNGGGIYNYQGIITLTNCTIAGNYVTCSGVKLSREGGGGIYNEQGSMTLTNCTIADNYAAGEIVLKGGGGIHNSEGNMTLTDCAFTGNSTSYDGGGMYNVYGESTLTNCTFSGNSASNDGGGFSNDYENVTLTNCVFSGNSAGHYGGGLFNSHFGSTVSNCTFIDNTAEQRGGGVCSYWLFLNSLTLTNCTFSGNSAGDLGGAVGIGITQDDKYVKLTNCILWDNSAEEGPQVGMAEYGDLYISYSCLGGGELDVYVPEATLFWDESNIDDNPLFVTGPSGDYYLSQVAAGQGANSPCVDAGSDTAVNLGMDQLVTRTDRMGDSGIVDMGYHYSNAIVINPDVSGDGRVDLVDFGIVSGWWMDSLCDGGNNFCGWADINYNGDVGLDDLLILAERWLEGVCFPAAAFGPDPDDGTSGINRDTQLSWSSGECAVSHNIYFGTGSPGVFQTNQAGTTFDPGPLDCQKTYYWRIDEVQADSSVIEGDVWSFTTIPPGLAFGPNPDDGRSGVSPDIELSWSSGDCAVSHNIYFGTGSPGVFQINQTETTFDPGALDLETMYYWRIDEVQGDSSVVEGDVWRFTTRSDMLVGHWELDESSGTVASDSVGGHDGTLMGDPVWRPSDGRIGGALEFDGVGDYVEVAGYKGISGPNPRTVTAWVRAESNGSMLSIVRWGTLEINGGLWSNVINADGKLRAAVWGGSVVGGTVINDDTWHHVAIVLPDKEDVKVEDILLYVDGEPEDTIISSGSQTIDTAVGMDVLISLDGSVGLLDDVRIYNYALSEEEIGALADVL